jgi:CDP-diacylglycerol--glycerol-3-phosphate 3-phosphatidyltransferase/archaetidylinositol phosphate synthase
MKASARQSYEEKTLFLGKFCAGLGLTPNSLTVSGVVAALISGILIWNHYFVAALFFMLASGLFDILDGATARFTRTSSAFGTVLDRVCDRYAEFFIAAGCAGSGRVHPVWVLFSLFGALMASYVRACAESAGRVKNCSVGLMERKEKAVLFAIGVLLEPLLNPRGLPADSLNPLAHAPSEGILVLQLAVILVGILSHITVYQRSDFARTHADGG